MFWNFVKHYYRNLLKGRHIPSLGNSTAFQNTVQQRFTKWVVLQKKGVCHRGRRNATRVPFCCKMDIDRRRPLQPVMTANLSLMLQSPSLPNHPLPRHGT